MFFLFAGGYWLSRNLRFYFSKMLMFQAVSVLKNGVSLFFGLLKSPFGTSRCFLPSAGSGRHTLENTSCMWRSIASSRPWAIFLKSVPWERKKPRGWGFLEGGAIFGWKNRSTSHQTTKKTGQTNPNGRRSGRKKRMTWRKKHGFFGGNSFLRVGKEWFLRLKHGVGWIIDSLTV